MTDEVQETTAQGPTPNPIQCIFCGQMHPVLPESGPPYDHYECPVYDMDVTLVNGQNPERKSIT